jgi:hypothetical protein
MRQKKNFEADDFESEFEDDLDQDDLDMFEETIALKISVLKRIGIKTVKKKNQEPRLRRSIVFNLGFYLNK